MPAIDLRGSSPNIPIEILAVEDNRGHQYLIEQALVDHVQPVRIHFSFDGDEAIQYLLKQGQFSEATTPDVIILDLNLPGKDGYEVLAEIKKTPELAKIPIIVLTSSELPDEKAKCNALEVSAFLTKPGNLDGFSRLWNTIDNICGISNGVADRDSLRAELRREREDRQRERKALRSKISNLEVRLLEKDAAIKTLLDDVKNK